MSYNNKRNENPSYECDENYNSNMQYNNGGNKVRQMPNQKYMISPGFYGQPPMGLTTHLNNNIMTPLQNNQIENKMSGLHISQNQQNYYQNKPIPSYYSQPVHPQNYQQQFKVNQQGMNESLSDNEMKKNEALDCINSEHQNSDQNYAGGNYNNNNGQQWNNGNQNNSVQQSQSMLKEPSCAFSDDGKKNPTPAIQKQPRRRRTDQDNRNFQCPCGKKYLSYPALYTHVKYKHHGKAPGDLIKPTPHHTRQGRPKGTTNRPKNIESQDDNASVDQQNEVQKQLEFLSYEIRDALNEECLLQDNQVNDKSKIIALLQSDVYSKDPKSMKTLLDTVLSKSETLSPSRDIEEEIDPQNMNFNMIFAEFIGGCSKYFSISIVKEVMFVIMMLRRIMNKKGWELEQQIDKDLQLSQELLSKEYCNEQPGVLITEIINDFVLVEFNKNLDQHQKYCKDFQLIKKSKQGQIIMVLTNFLHWMFVKQYIDCFLDEENQSF